MRPTSHKSSQPKDKEKTMFKKILIILCTTLAAGYLLLAITAFNRRAAGQVCTGLELLIKDSLNASFITSKELQSLLDKEGLNPVGKKLDEVNTRQMEAALDKHTLIDAAECYKTPGGKVCVEVIQRIPILRIMSDNGEDYYIDNKGHEMPTSTKCTAHLAVVTGHVSKEFAARELYPFGLFLQENDFWNILFEEERDYYPYWGLMSSHVYISESELKEYHCPKFYASRDEEDKPIDQLKKAYKLGWQDIMKITRFNLTVNLEY